jgi:hypothetical protein
MLSTSHAKLSYSVKIRKPKRKLFAISKRLQRRSEKGS